MKRELKSNISSFRLSLGSLFGALWICCVDISICGRTIKFSAKFEIKNAWKNLFFELTDTAHTDGRKKPETHLETVNNNRRARKRNPQASQMSVNFNLAFDLLKEALPGPLSTVTSCAMRWSNDLQTTLEGSQASLLSCACFAHEIWIFRSREGRETCVASDHENRKKSKTKTRRMEEPRLELQSRVEFRDWELHPKALWASSVSCFSL